MTTPKVRGSTRSRTLNTSALGAIEVSYRKGYKYQLAKEVNIFVGIFPDHDIRTPFINLDMDGWLSIRGGYAWDGMSGAMDTKNSMLASLVHDALYQLMRHGHLPLSHRRSVDLFFHTIMRAKGMWKGRAAYIYRAVREVAEFAAEPASIKPILTA